MIVICKKCKARYQLKLPPGKALDSAGIKCKKCGHDKFTYGGGQALNNRPVDRVQHLSETMRRKRRRPISTFSPRGKSRMLDLGEDILRDAQK